MSSLPTLSTSLWYSPQDLHASQDPGQIRSPESVGLCCLADYLQPGLPHLRCSTRDVPLEECQPHPFMHDLGQHTLEGVLKFVSRDHKGSLSKA